LNVTVCFGRFTTAHKKKCGGDEDQNYKCDAYPARIAFMRNGEASSHLCQMFDCWIVDRLEKVIFHQIIHRDAVWKIRRSVIECEQFLRDLTGTRDARVVYTNAIH